MRGFDGPGMQTGSFEESLRGLLRNSPWWMTSLCIHLVVLAVLLQIPVDVRGSNEAKQLTTEIVEELQPLDETPPPEPPPVPPPETKVETPLETEDEVPAEEEEPVIEPEGDEGDTEGPFEGAWTNTAIGLTGGAGGPGKKGGGRGRVKGRLKWAPLDYHVELGLKWLADHQDVDEDGRWDCDDYMKHDDADDRCTGGGGALYDVGVTGLAVLAFLGAGYTDRGAVKQNPYARNVRQGLRYLLHNQDEDGCFGTRSSEHFMYNHAIASLAVCEAYWMTRNPRYRKPAQEGLSFIARARNPYLAWRYEPRGGENDTSVTGWMVMALKAGKWAGLEIDPDAFEGARQWVDRMTDPVFGQVGYNMPGGPPARPEGLQDQFPPEKSQSMTAVGMLTRIFLGEDPRLSEAIRKGADLCMERLPQWDPDDGSIDMYYWYYGTLAVFQVGNPYWNKWNRAIKQAIAGSQYPQKSGARTGSWDPIGVWGGDGGRVYATASMVMCLEVYYRYGQVFGMVDRK